ncbi:hypothetical protein JCM30760_22400 [Thiomicrorhabdus hydrogeniphila]
MRYYLESQLINPTPQIELTEEEFNKIKHAKSTLKAALEIEDKYDLIVSAYVDLEKDVLALTTENMVRWRSSYESFHETRTLVNRRLITILTAARLYLDRLPSKVAKCTDNRAIKSEVESLKSHEYDTNFEYRFIEALRNSVQHSNLPVHSVSHGIKRLDIDTDKDVNQYKSSYMANKSEFVSDGNFKRAVFKELPEKVDLLHSVRVYIACLSNIHIQTRALIKEFSDDARTVIENQITVYGEANEQNTVALEAVKENGLTKVESFIVMTDWDDVRLSLIKKNGLLKNLEKRFIRS